MFLFPLIYIFSFIYAIILLFRKEIKGVAIFIVYGLPIYIHALSISFMYGFVKFIPLLQSFKEISILGGLALILFTLKKRPELHIIDKLVLVFLIYTFAYVLLPIGTYDFYSRLLAFKSLSFFTLIYFVGRFCDARSININKLFSYICLVIIIAAVVVVGFEVIPNEHLHTRTGFMDFGVYYFNFEVSGNYGLIWTFETETGLKRFGSIFSSPLELSTATIVALSILLPLATTNRHNIRFTTFNIISFLATLACIIFAVSRASFAGYFIVIYVFAWITHNKILIKIFHYSFLAVIFYIFFLLKGDLFDFIVDTLSFKNASSIGHVLEWLNGITAIAQHPLGLGLGTSGRISMESRDNIGGENQLIIIGVQAGILMVIIYVLIYIQFIKIGIEKYKTSTTKIRKLSMAIILLKIGLIIPLLTTNTESFIYMSYLSWFLSGLLINLVMNNRISLLSNSGPLNKGLPNRLPKIS